MPPLAFALSLVFASAQASRADVRLDVQAERGPAGTSGDGWQHIALTIHNLQADPVSGRATLYEWDAQVGARPRIELPFAVTDRQILHFYPFRPPEPPAPSSYILTLHDDQDRPISFPGASQTIINGRSIPSLRADVRFAPGGDFLIAVWGDSGAYLRGAVSEWNPSLDEIYLLADGRLDMNQFNAAFNSRPVPVVAELSEPRLLPDSYVGFGEMDVLFAFGSDIDQELTERQRRALADWIRSGGVLIFVPRTKQQLSGPFLSRLLDLRDQGEVTSEGDRHLEPAADAAVPHRIVHFLTGTERDRDVLVSYGGHPVVYSSAAGFGRVWIVGFDPTAHGGAKRYDALWFKILNQALKHRLVGRASPAWLSDHAWSPDSDRAWLGALRERFGKSPNLSHLALLVAAYMLLVGPANFFILKRREARPLLLATVPAIALVFGGLVFGMGFISHGVRAAMNQLALAVVPPEGDTAFVEEFIGVYGTTSAEYRLGFPRGLPLRPVDEFRRHPSSGFETAPSFRVVAEADRSWLRDWRLTFWQTRATASVASVPLDGRLTATRQGDKWTISNQTPIEFDSILLSGSTTMHSAGSLQPFEVTRVDVRSDDPTQALTLSARLERNEEMGPIDPEAGHLLRAASARLPQRDRHWVLGFTRQAVRKIDSPDTHRHLTMSLYVWPAEPGPAPALPAD